MIKQAKNIICFHGNCTNNYIMSQQMIHIINNSKINFYSNNGHLTNTSSNNHDLDFNSNNSYYNIYNIVNGHIIDNKHIINLNNIFKYNNKNLRSWIYDHAIFDDKFVLQENNIYKEDYYKVTNELKQCTDNMYKLLNKKIDCAISFSNGIFPLIHMMEKNT